MTTSLGSYNFWAALVLNEESSYAGFSEGLFPFTNSEVTTKAYAKRRLVEHGRNSAARTTLIDDQSDYYDFKEKSWLYKQQVKGELVLTPLLVTISVIEVNIVGFSLMINLFHSEVGMHLLWFIIRKCLSSYSALVMFDTHWDLKIWKLHCSPKAQTVSVPDDGVVKAASLPSHAYITFLAGNGDHVKSVVALAKGLRKVKGAYPFAVVVLPDILEGHHKILVKHGCTACEIELICPPENLNQFAMAFYVINYSKLRIWKFVESSKMAMLEILLEHYQDVSFHVMSRMLRVRTGLCYEQLVSVGLRNKLAAAAVDSLECEIAMVRLYFLVMIVQPNLFGPQMQATSLKAALDQYRKCFGELKSIRTIKRDLGGLACARECLDSLVSQEKKAKWVHPLKKIEELMDILDHGEFGLCDLRQSSFLLVTFSSSLEKSWTGSYSCSINGEAVLEKYKSEYQSQGDTMVQLDKFWHSCLLESEGRGGFVQVLPKELYASAFGGIMLSIRIKFSIYDVTFAFKWLLPLTSGFNGQSYIMVVFGLLVAQAIGDAANVSCWGMFRAIASATATKWRRLVWDPGIGIVFFTSLRTRIF